MFPHMSTTWRMKYSEKFCSLLVVSVIEENYYYAFMIFQPSCTSPCNLQIQGLYSVTGPTPSRNISWSLEAVRFRFRIFQSLYNLTGTSAAALPGCLSNLRVIQSLVHPISRLRDFTRFDGKTPIRLVNKCPGFVPNDYVPLHEKYMYNVTK